MSNTDDLDLLHRILVSSTRTESEVKAINARLDREREERDRERETTKSALEESDSKIEALGATVHDLGRAVRKVQTDVRNVKRVAGGLTAIGSAIAGVFKIKGGQGQ